MLPTQTPQQMQLSNQAGNAAMGLFGRLGSPDTSGFAPIANRAMSRFQTDIVPSLAERFTAMGGHGALASSGFQGTLGRAGADLSEGLAALESEYGSQQQGLNNQLLSILLSGGMTPQYQNIYTQATPGFKQGIAGSLGSGAGMGLGLLSRLLGI